MLWAYVNRLAYLVSEAHADRSSDSATWLGRETMMTSLILCLPNGERPPQPRRYHQQPAGPAT
jgi:hypothetical protein